MYSYVLKQFELDSTLHPPPSTPFLGWGRGGGGEEFVLCFVFCVFLLHDTFPEPEPEPEPGPGRAAGQIQSNPILSYHIPHIPISHFPYPIFPCSGVSGVSGLRFLRFTVYGLCLFMLYRVREGWMVRLGFRIGGTVEGPIREGIGEGGEGRMLFHSKSQEMDG